MSEGAPFDRMLAALHDATLDDAQWPAASAIFDDVCRTKGNFLAYARGPSQRNVEIDFIWIYYRGERCHDLEREYTHVYYPRDERIPRLIRLPDSRLVRCADLYTDEELKSSATYNEVMLRGQAQKSLVTRMDGPRGSRITWTLADPVDADGWSSAQIDLIRKFLPHLRQYVRVRQALADAGALGASLARLADKTGSGIIQLDRRGRIVETNDEARDLLVKGDALHDRRGLLCARLPADDAVLQRLLAGVLPGPGGQGASGSLRVRRPNGLPGLTVHLSPAGDAKNDFRPRRVAAIVLMVDDAPTRIDPALVEAAFGFTPAESRVAVLLAEGRTVRDIAAVTGRTERTVRWHIQQAFDKLGISRQVELVLQVLSLASPPSPVSTQQADVGRR